MNPVDAARNAKEHNNQGVIFLNEGDFYAAVREFEIAIGLNPNTQATSVYYNNLGRAYMEMYRLTNDRRLLPTAQFVFERAVLQDCMNISYYQNLVDTYDKQGILDTKLNFLLENVKKNPYNQVIAGLIYLKQNKIGAAITILDDFCARNPDLAIVDDLKRLIKTYDII